MLILPSWHLTIIPVDVINYFFSEAPPGQLLIRTDSEETIFIRCPVRNYLSGSSGTKIAIRISDYCGKDVPNMSLLAGLFKIIIWAARSVALVFTVLFLSTLLRFAKKSS
jgi:hypothetical protein